MSTVTLSIGPKSYTVACADGQEDHITALGAMIAEKYAQLGSARAPLEAQNLLFAALFMADELAELRKRAGSEPQTGSGESESLLERVATLESELAEARAAAARTASSAPASEPSATPAQPDNAAEALAERLEALAARAEASAAALEAGAASA